MPVNPSACALYVVFVLFCSAGMLFFYHNLNRYTDRTPENRWFQASLLLAALSALCDVFYGLREFRVVRLGYFVNTLSETLYILSGTWSGYCWFMCSETVQKSVTMRSRRNRLLCSLPVLGMTLLVSTNGLHGLCFTFADEVYFRGSLHLPNTVLVALLILSSGTTALYRSFRTQVYSNRALYRELFLYALAMLATLTLQLLFGRRIPYRTITTTVVFYLAQDRILKSNVLLDRLSGLNNRAVLEKHLLTRFPKAGESFYYVLLDMDRFKQVNDRYGHAAGDKAISLMGLAMRSGAQHGLLLARYGGDEFVMIGDFPQREALEALLQRVQEKLEALCTAEKLPFTLHFSAGYANRSPEITSISQLCALADANMYKRKHGKTG